jgi:hypothetical protein
MAITSLDGLIAAAKQRCEFYKTASRTTVAGGWFSRFDLAGNPGAGTLAIGNTANGVVPTDATAGYPPINAFSGGPPVRGYLMRAAIKNTVVSQVRLFDRIFAAGAYAFNANTNLASQPSFASRVSLNGGSAIYSGLELWVEQVTAATGNQAVSVGYTDQDGNAGASTGAVGIGAAPTVGRCWQLPFAAGDSGLQLISNVTGSVATVGTFNVMVLRPLADINIGVANEVKVLNFTDLGLPELFADSAMFALVMSPSGTALGTMDIGDFDIANG